MRCWWALRVNRSRGKPFWEYNYYPVIFRPFNLTIFFFFSITRNGLVKDINDERSKPLLHIIKNIIPKSRSLKYILVENVKGFECSLARDLLVSTLNQSGFTYREFLLSPTHFGICNSRLRYYLLAKKIPLDFSIPLQNDIVSRKSTNKIKQLKIPYTCTSTNCFFGESVQHFFFIIFPQDTQNRFGIY